MPERTPYDEIPYSSYPFEETHPDRLSTVAFLYGIDAAPVAGARVLELGCGSGANLLGIAQGLTGGRAVGVDLAPTAIEQARKSAREVGLDNVEFHTGDLTELVDGRHGEFDYVIAHGVYAWVSAPVRDALMAATAAHLAPSGIGYVSYNCQPGGHFRAALRDLALWYTRDLPNGTERAIKAKELFGALKGMRSSDDPYGALLATEIPGLAEQPVEFMSHDLLGDNWEPVWFADFAAVAERHGLGYVGDAGWTSLLEDHLPGDAEAQIRALAGGDRIAFEQIADFLTWARFRRSLVCHAGLERFERFDRRRVEQLHFRAAMLEVVGEGLGPRVIEHLIARRPASVTFEELRDALGADADELVRTCMQIGWGARITMHREPPRFGTPGQERPLVTPLARWQAAEGDRATTLINKSISIDGEGMRTLLVQSDGTHTRAELKTAVARAVGVEEPPDEALEGVLVDLAALGLLSPDGG